MAEKYSYNDVMKIIGKQSLKGYDEAEELFKSVMPANNITGVLAHSTSIQGAVMDAFLLGTMCGIKRERSKQKTFCEVSSVSELPVYSIQFITDERWNEIAAEQKAKREALGYAD